MNEIANVLVLTGWIDRDAAHDSPDSAQVHIHFVSPTIEWSPADILEIITSPLFGKESASLLDSCLDRTRQRKFSCDEFHRLMDGAKNFNNKN